MSNDNFFDDLQPVSEADSFPIKIEGFEGPLDLLLYLIRNQEIDIYDIPIATITGQYLDYVKMMKLLNLEVAGEYVLMAATLIRIKARLLMPRHSEIDGDDEDPREELIMALLEYKRFKEASEKFAILEVKERQVLKRHDFSYLSPEVQETFTIEATLYDLVRAFSEVMKTAAEQPKHEVDNFELSIEDQIEYILGILETTEQTTLTSLVQANQRRIYYVVTFLALLELIKLQRISASQHQHFGEIYVVRL
jgi:segregation and condensation protein A